MVYQLVPYERTGELLNTLFGYQPGGGTRAFTSVEAEPRPVSYAREVIEQKLAEVQTLSSARVLKVSLDLRGSLLDILA